MNGHLPLDGIRILAIEQYGAGPFGTQHLADLGAEVIKIENPREGGDIGRQDRAVFLRSRTTATSMRLSIVTRKSIALDLKSEPERKGLPRSRARPADATLDNLRGDLPVKLGLDYANLFGANRKIVCVHPVCLWPHRLA